jgi:hypothetical protein
MLYYLRKAFSFNKAIKRPLAAYRIIPNLLKLEDRLVPVTGATLVFYKKSSVFDCIKSFILIKIVDNSTKSLN